MKKPTNHTIDLYVSREAAEVRNILTQFAISLAPMVTDIEWRKRVDRYSKQMLKLFKQTIKTVRNHGL